MSGEALFSQLGWAAAWAYFGLGVLFLAAHLPRAQHPDSRERALGVVLPGAALLLAVPFLAQSLSPLSAVRAQWVRGLPAGLSHALMPSSDGGAWSAAWFVGVAWAAGVVVGGGLLCWRWARLQSELGEALPGASRLQSVADALARELGVAAPAVLVSARLKVPCCVGVLSPRILFPVGFADALDDEALTLVLRHELLHLARGDVRAAFTSELLSRLFPLHPLARRTVAELRLMRECAVDLRASAQTPHRYASLLVDAAEESGPSFERLHPVSFSKDALTRRIHMLTRPFPVRRALPRWLAAVSLVSLLSGALLLPRPASAGEQPSAELRVSVGQSVSLDSAGVTKLAIADPAVADVRVEDAHVAVRGLKPGSTTLLIWKKGQDRASYVVKVE